MPKSKQVTVVIMEGEATGHAHRATGRGLVLRERSFTVPEEAVITHEEHHRRVLPGLPEGYEIRRVVELDPAGDKKEVID